MGYIIVDRERDGEGIRHEMRRNMRGDYRTHDGGYSPMMRGGSYEHAYKKGYEHGWEDAEDDMDKMEMRRRRNSLGQFI